MHGLAALALLLPLAVACKGAPDPDPLDGFDPGAIAQSDATTDLPASARAVLENAHSFEILSTQTTRGNFEGDLGEDHVLRYPILGRTTVEAAPTQHEILDLLYTAFRENDSEAARCFIPRHAIVARRGGERVILVVCFECMQWRGIGPQGEFRGLLGKSTRDTINRIWRDHGLELAK